MRTCVICDRNRISGNHTVCSACANTLDASAPGWKGSDWMRALNAMDTAQRRREKRDTAVVEELGNVLQTGVLPLTLIDRVRRLVEEGYTQAEIVRRLAASASRSTLQRAYREVAGTRANGRPRGARSRTVSNG